MSISRVHTWSNGEVLTHTDLNAEFDNILNNAHSLTFPLTADGTFGGFKATGLGLGLVSSPSVQFTGDTNTGIYSSAADTFDIAAGGIRAASFATVALGVNYLELNPSVATAAVKLDSEGSDTNINIDVRPKGSGVLLVNGETVTGFLASQVYSY